MKLKIKTLILKDIINKVIKASTNNKMVPLTSLLYLSVKGGIIRAVASDAVNYFEISAECNATEDFDVVLKGDIFSKIVSKTTSEYITLELNKDILTFNGNGTYKIELPLDEEGNPIKYPTYANMGEVIDHNTIQLATIKSAVLANKPALAVTAEAPYLMNYYCGEEAIVTADSFNICINKSKIVNKPILLSPMVFDLLSVFTSETIDYDYDGSRVAFTSSNMKIYGKVQNNIEDYPIEPIMGYEDIELPSSCAISKSALVSVIDRLSLFISDFDVNGVYLDFTKEGVKVTPKNKVGSELITYAESSNFEPFICLVSVDALKKQANARSGDILYIQYGISNALKFVDNNITHIVALLEDEVEDEEAPVEISEDMIEDNI